MFDFDHVIGKRSSETTKDQNESYEKFRFNRLFRFFFHLVLKGSLAELTLNDK